MAIRFFTACCLMALPSLGVAQDQRLTRYEPVTVIAKSFPPITHPKFVDGKNCKLTGNELVIGVEVDGKARAYPINQLTGPRREIINDNLGGTPIAATW